MRGIKKLVLALFFMTLFGAGFKVEAKADMQVELALDTASGKPDFSGTKITTDSDSYYPAEPTGSASDPYKYDCTLVFANDKSLYIEAGSLWLRTLKGDTSPQWQSSIDKGDSWQDIADATTAVPIDIKSMLEALDIEDIKDCIVYCDDSEGNKLAHVTLKVNSVDGSGSPSVDIVSNSEDADLGCVTVNAFCGEKPVKGVKYETDTSYVKKENIYLFSGETSKKITHSDGDASYKFIEWTGDKTGTAKDITITMGSTVQSKKITAEFGQFHLTEEPSIISQGETYRSEYTYEGYLVIDSATVTTETGTAASNIDVSLKPNTMDNSGTVTVTARSGATPGKYNLTFETYEGQKYNYPFTVSSSPKGYTINLDANGGSVSPATWTTDEDGHVVVNDLPTPTWSNHDFQGWYDESSSGTKITNNTTLKEGQTIYAHWSGSSSSTTIKVTEDKTIMLSQFGFSGDHSVEVKSGYSKNVSVSPKSGDASKIKFRGVRETDGAVTGLTIDGEDADLVVYDWPDFLFVGTSSTPYVEIYLPEGVYHDGVMMDDVYEGIVFINSSSRRGTGNYFEVGDGDAFSWDYLSDLLRKTYKVDSNTVTLTLCPMNSDGYDAVVTDQLKLYKINFDYSGGAASYKVNDVTISKDTKWFYAIEGLEYNISATNDSGYSNTVEKWEGVSFSGTSGKAKFTSSTNVKANFKSNTTPTPTPTTTPTKSLTPTGTPTKTPGGGGGDYDDVPKTGESKTDIWILWSVLFISILGAGFMIYKRFGLVKAIARAEEEAALVEREERVEAEKKEKKEKMDLLKSLRDL